MALPLYRSPVVRQGLGPALRPGGEELTRRILDLTRPERDQFVLDAGCGPGATLGLLRSRGLRKVLGIDRDQDFLHEARHPHSPVIQADLGHIPLADRSVDLVLCECAWNLGPREQVLAEFGRIVRPGGVLAIADIFVRTSDQGGQDWPVPCCFAGASDLARVRSLVKEAGFAIAALEDHSRLLRQTAARFVFAHGSLHGFWLAVTGNADQADQACRAAAAARPGLFMLIATRSLS